MEMHDIMQKEFINIASHELRTPIQPILSLIEILRSKINDNYHTALLDVTIGNAKRLQRLTEDISDVTRIGIVPELLPRRFTKLATKSIITGGTGLGLCVSKSIVEANGGQIRAESNKNSKGATFTFSLPVRK